MTDQTKARHVALNVSAAALLLALAKAIVGLATGSIAVLSSALDSAADVLSSFANYVFLTIAAKPPDEDHPFGHGKAEHLAALMQGVILLAGSILLGAKAAERIREPHPIEASTIAIVMMVASIVATVGITAYLKRHAVAEENSALAGDALHYTSDIVANGATIAALVLVQVTGNTLIDPIFGVTVACWIAWNSLYLIWNAGNDLMDPSLPDNEIQEIIDAIEEAHPSVLSFEDLRTRRAAGMRFVVFDLLIDRKVSFEEAHDATEAAKEKIRERFPRTIITVHAEPVDR